MAASMDEMARMLIESHGGFEKIGSGYGLTGREHSFAVLMHAFREVRRAALEDAAKAVVSAGDAFSPAIRAELSNAAARIRALNSSSP